MVNLIIDWNNLSMRTLYIKDVYAEFKNAEKNCKIDNVSYNCGLTGTDILDLKDLDQNFTFNFYKHKMFEGIAYFFKNVATQTDLSNEKNVYIAVDSKSWRKDVYPEYKANRVKDDKDKFFWEIYHHVFYNFLEEIKKFMGIWYVIKSDMAEADDIIAVLLQEKFNINSFKNYILSSDKDFRQLLDLPFSVNIYDSDKKQFMEAEPGLLEKMIIMGDRGDNIKPIEKGIGIVKAEKIIKENKLQELLQNPEIKNNYHINRRLISLKKDNLPFFVVEGILDEYGKKNELPSISEMDTIQWAHHFYTDIAQLKRMM